MFIKLRAVPSIHNILQSPTAYFKMLALSRQRVLVICTAALLVLIFIFSALHSDSAPIRKLKDAAQTVQDSAQSAAEKVCSNRPAFSNPSKPSVKETLSNLFSSIQHPITQPYFDPFGNYFNLSQIPWKERLGSQVLIVDIDTRVPDGTNQLWNPTKINWETLDTKQDGGMVSASFMNHFIYASIHGYDYKFFNAEPMKDHHNTWVKPHVLYELLHSYRFVVFIDADATIQHLEVPLEWLLNRWNFDPEKTSIAMPIDTRQILNNDENASCDSKGKVTLNTGVIVAQALPYTFDMLTAWKTCTNGNRYKDCGQWKENWSHEQRAFSEYIRYDFNPEGNNIVEIPCDEAMGYPGLKANHPHILSDCNGQFVRHHTIDKDWVKSAGDNALQQTMAELIQKTLLEKANRFRIQEGS